MKLIYDYEQRRIREFAGEMAETQEPGSNLKQSLFMFSIYALLIVAAACYLPEIGEKIAKLTGLGDSFIGSSFIAITTSLPEITVSIAAARMGAFDMAVANLLGSNLFNVAILGVIDFCYRKGPLLSSVSSTNVITALMAILSTAIVVIGLSYRSSKKFLFLAGDAIAILLVYALSNYLLVATAQN